jgi:hypothetical protein
VSFTDLGGQKARVFFFLEQTSATRVIDQESSNCLTLNDKPPKPKQVSHIAMAEETSILFLNLSYCTFLHTPTPLIYIFSLVPLFHQLANPTLALYFSFSLIFHLALN